MPLGILLLKEFYMAHPFLSVIIPVYNEGDNLHLLYDRLTLALGALGKSFEIIFTNDGSRDNSLDILKDFHQRRPTQICVIDFNGNFGQHQAIMAGFEKSRGDVIVTLDADLQNPPEEIYKLLAEMDKGHDVVEGVRMMRQDNAFRRWASKLCNKLREKITGIKLTDQGSMLRAYSRRVVDLMVMSHEASAFIPALAYSFSSNPGEVNVKHESRAAGESKYTFYRLLRLNFDLMTGYSLVPLQFFTFLGVCISSLSFLFVIYMFARRLILGPEAEGVFTLFAIAFLLMGIILFGLGIVGEYVGRIYQEIRKRPRHVIRHIIE